MAKPERSDVEQLVSLEAFQRMPEQDAFRVELVRGRIVREPRPAPLHARLLAGLTYEIEAFVRRHGGGVVLTDAGFLLSVEPPTVRGPDLAFVSAERVPERPYDAGFWRLAPDLAIEIVSPSNSASEIQEKVLDYLDGGSRLVWLVDPRPRTVTVYRSRDAVRVLDGDAVLDGEDVLPGFRLALRDLFAL